MRAFRVLLWGAVLMLVLQAKAFAQYEEAFAMTDEIKKTLEELNDAMLENDQARAIALTSSYGQKYRALDNLGTALAVNEPLRFALLEDRIRLLTQTHLSVLLAMRPYVSEADRVGIDRSLQVYLNSREHSMQEVAQSLLKEAREAKSGRISEREPDDEK